MSHYRHYHGKFSHAHDAYRGARFVSRAVYHGATAAHRSLALMAKRGEHKDKGRHMHVDSKYDGHYRHGGHHSHNSSTGGFGRPHHFGMHVNHQGGGVTRSYKSTIMTMGVTPAQNFDGFGWSFRCQMPGGVLDCGIRLGGPATGAAVGTPAAVTFPELNDDIQWFGQVFRYLKVKSLKFCVVRQPMITTTPTEGTPTGGPVEQDMGTMTLAAWAGEPAEVNYNNGALAFPSSGGSWPIDVQRKKHSHSFPARMDPGDRRPERYLYITPVSQIAIPDEANDSTDNQIQYIQTPRVDYYKFAVGDTDLNSYGGMCYWYHPQSTITPWVAGSVRWQFSWEVEFEWYGLHATPPFIAAELEKIEGPGGRLEQYKALKVDPPKWVMERLQYLKKHKAELDARKQESEFDFELADMQVDEKKSVNQQQKAPVVQPPVPIPQLRRGTSPRR